jgi:hypothetical protein
VRDLYLCKQSIIACPGLQYKMPTIKLKCQLCERFIIYVALTVKWNYLIIRIFNNYRLLWCSSYSISYTSSIDATRKHRWNSREYHNTPIALKLNLNFETIMLQRKNILTIKWVGNNANNWQHPLIMNDKQLKLTSITTTRSVYP